MDFKNLKWYRAGKITVLNGAQVVNGTNTNWLEADIKPGDVFYTADGPAYEVENVLTSEQLTIKEPYQGDTVVNGDYKIIRRVPAVMQTEIANRLVTVLGEWDRRDRTFTETLRLLTTHVEEIDERTKHSGVLAIPITIPATGWLRDEHDMTGYPWHVDIPNDVIREDMTSFLTISLNCMGTAFTAVIAPVAQTLDKALRVFARSVPTSAISATLALFGAAISPSSEDDDLATDEEVWEAINDVLNEP